eukprot:3127548-Ditylum_brightwellii.AAC.1
MGICKLPSKRDYWPTHKYMPSHAITTKFGMSDTEYYQSDMHESDYDTEEDDDDDELCEQIMDKVQRDEEDMHGNDLFADISDEDEDEGSRDNQPAEDSGEHPRKKDV